MPTYPPTPLGVPLGEVPLDDFSGQPSLGSPPTPGIGGQVYFSPALPAPNTGSQIDVNSVETVVHAADQYNPAPTPASPNPASNGRPWLWGPPKAPSGRAFPPDFNIPFYEPVWNSWVVSGQGTFVWLQTTLATVMGTLVDVPTGHTTIILY
jgi:hypothetical protein